MARSVSQIQTDGQLRLFENLLSPHCRSVILFHKPVSFPLRLERVNRWERIASRRRPAFSSHLINAHLVIHSWIVGITGQSLPICSRRKTQSRWYHKNFLPSSSPPARTSIFAFKSVPTPTRSPPRMRGTTSQPTAPNPSSNAEVPQ